MPNGNYKVPEPSKEPVLSYIDGSSEKQAVKEALKEAKSQEKDVPMYIGSNEIRTGQKIKMSPPHNQQFV